ncbi:MerR family transcriptional regulator [Priestia megaterium]
MNKQLQLDSDRLYTGKEVAELTGYKADSIKKMCNEYDIETPRTEGGHRRYTAHNIEVLLAIKDKRENDDWSVKQIQDWLKGKETVFNTHIPKTQDEMKYERLETKYEQLEKAFRVVIQKTNQDRELDKRQREEERKQMLQMLEEEREKDRKLMMQMLEKQREEDRKHYELLLKEQLGSRDQKFLTSVREIQQSHKEIATTYQEQMEKKPKTLREKIAYIFGSSK